MGWKQNVLTLILCASCSALVVSCKGSDAPLSRTERVLGTQCTITMYDHASPETLDACFARLREIEARMSVRTPDSELDAVNDAAGKEAVRVTEDVLVVVRRALDLARLSNGLFDPTVGPLVKLWGVTTNHARVPSPAEIKAALALVNWRDVALDEGARTIALRKASMNLDVGGIAKGYAADEMVRILGARGVRSALVDLGGNVFAVGSKPDGEPWRIGIQDPDAPRGTYMGIVAVRNRTVVTSGVYERFFMKDGKRYHHIMDTRTGYPVSNGLASATVIADRSFEADGATLALFCLGPRDGILLAEKLGLDAVMLGADHTVYATQGVRRSFHISNPLFSYAREK